MSKGNLRLGYATDNLELKEKGILINRTCRQQTFSDKGIEYITFLVEKNLEGLFKILQWNEKNGIKFYRISSGMFPHITNPHFIKNKKDFRCLAYKLELFNNQLKKIGKFVLKHKHRITMHPDPFISLGTSDNDLLIRNTRDLYYHVCFLDLLGVDLNSTITIHGGGAYGDKTKTIKIWINNFNNLPIEIKRRIALENDEFTYSAQDVLYISSKVNSYSNLCDKKYKIPIIFDIFHYYCYNKTIELKELENQSSISELLPHFIQSWKTRRIKMHIAEQHPTRTRGAHSEYVKIIPTILRNMPKKYNINLDLMVEAKAKEKSIMYLRNKYGGSFESLKIN